MKRIGVPSCIGSPRRCTYTAQCTFLTQCRAQRRAARRLERIAQRSGRAPARLETDRPRSRTEDHHEAQASLATDGQRVFLIHDSP